MMTGLSQMHRLRRQLGRIGPTASPRISTTLCRQTLMLNIDDASESLEIGPQPEVKVVGISVESAQMVTALAGRWEVSRGSTGGTLHESRV